MSESEEKPKESKYSHSYFVSELKRAEEARKKFFSEAEESIALYASNKLQQKLPDVHRKISIWWSVVNTLMPAYFSRIPKVESTLRKKSGNSLHNSSAVVVERSGQYVLEEEIPFATEGHQAILQFMLTGQAVLKARYESKTAEKAQRVKLLQGEDETYTYLDGSAHDGDVMSDDDGHYTELPYEEKESEQAHLEAVHYRDFLQSVCRNSNEVEWKAYRAFLSKEQVRAKFGDKADGLKYDVVPEDLKDDHKHDTVNTYEGKTALWEVWCKETKKVYWLTRGTSGDATLFVEGEPPVDFHDFWPSVELYANIIPDSVIPIGDYVQVKDQILEVERLTTRIHAVTNAIRTNFAHDAALTELADLYTGDLKSIPVAQWPQHKSAGGIGSMIEFAPVQPYVQALDTLLAARDRALDKLYESMKASDLMRGVTAPMETATAQQLKANSSNFQFGARQRQVEEFFSNAIAKVVEIVCEHYSPERLYEIANGQEVVSKLLKEAQFGGQPITPESIWEEIIAIIGDDPRRRYRISIASDSMIALDERADRQERVDFMSSVGGFMGQLTQMIEGNPVMMPLAVNILRFVMRSYKAGKELEADLEGMLGELTKAAQQKAQQQQQGADGEGGKGVEAQAKLQIAQLEHQEKQMQHQLEMEKLQVETELKQAELQLKAAQIENERDKLQLELATLQGQTQIDALRIGQEERKIEAGMRKEELDTIQESIKAQAQIATHRGQHGAA